MRTLATSKSLLALFLLVASLLACKGLGLGSSSPTSTFKALYEAQKKKDVPGIKKTLSKGSLAMVEQGAKDINRTLDELLKVGFDPAFKAGMPNTRNEKINSDTATLEVQDDESKKWETLYFVKEDGDWKLALDKTQEELFKKLGQ